MVIFRVQAHIFSSPQVPFCTWTASGIGSQFRALGLGCRGGKSGPGGFLWGLVLPESGGTAWQGLGDLFPDHPAVIPGDFSPENRL